MTPGVVLFNDEDLEPTHRTMQGRRASVDARPNNDDIRSPCPKYTTHRSTALTAAGVFGKAASSPRVIGLIGGRRRYPPTSAGETPRASAINSVTVSPQSRPWHGPIPQRRNDFI